MFTKHLSIPIAAGILVLGIAAGAQAEEQGKTIGSQEQVMTMEQRQARLNAGMLANNKAGDQTMTQDRTQTQDRLKDGTGDQAADRLQDHDMIHEHQGGGSGGMGSGGMGGPRR